MTTPKTAANETTRQPTRRLIVVALCQPTIRILFEIIDPFIFPKDSEVRNPNPKDFPPTNNIFVKSDLATRLDCLKHKLVQKFDFSVRLFFF